MPQQVAPMSPISDDRQHELTNDDIEWSSVEPGRIVGSHVGLVEPKRVTCLIDGGSQRLGGTHGGRAHVDPGDGEATIVEPLRQPAITTPDVEQGERWLARGRRSHICQEPVEMRCRLLTGNRRGVDSSPVVPCIAIRNVFQPECTGGRLTDLPISSSPDHASAARPRGLALPLCGSEPREDRRAHRFCAHGRAASGDVGGADALGYRPLHSRLDRPRLSLQPKRMAEHEGG